MTKMQLIEDDGGRQAHGYEGHTKDCVVRAITIASQMPYRQVYEDLYGLQRTMPGNSRAAKDMRLRPEIKHGVHRKIYEPYLLAIGFDWTPTQFFGSNSKVHLRADELPDGRLVVKCRSHLCAVINGILHDIGDYSRNGTRIVYGYYRLRS